MLKNCNISTKKVTKTQKTHLYPSDGHHLKHGVRRLGVEDEDVDHSREVHSTWILWNMENISQSFPVTLRFHIWIKHEPPFLSTWRRYVIYLAILINNLYNIYLENVKSILPWWYSRETRPAVSRTWWISRGLSRPGYRRAGPRTRASIWTSVHTENISLWFKPKNLHLYVYIDQ